MEANARRCSTSLHRAVSGSGFITPGDRNLRDEADNHLVELAVAGRAEMIVTRNLRDVRNMELRFPGLRVCAPEEFLEALKP